MEPGAVAVENNSWLRVKYEECKSQFNKTFTDERIKKIKEIAINIFKFIAGVALFVMNPAIFATGVIVGVVWDKQADETIDKIVNIAKEQQFPVLLGLGVASILCLQVTSGAASLLYGAYVGSLLSLNSKSKEVAAQ